MLHIVAGIDSKNQFRLKVRVIVEKACGEITNFGKGSCSACSCGFLAPSSLNCSMEQLME